MKFLSPSSWIKFLVRGIFAVLLLVGWGVAALAVHVVVVPHEKDDGSESWRVVVVPKERLGVDDTYVDTRAWTEQEAAEHAALLARLTDAGKGDSVADLLTDTAVRRAVEEVLGNLGGN